MLRPDLSCPSLELSYQGLLLLKRYELGALHVRKQFVPVNDLPVEYFVTQVIELLKSSGNGDWTEKGGGANIPPVR